jgi:hypothetical protein
MWGGAVGAFINDESGIATFEFALLFGLLLLAFWAICQAGQQQDQGRVCGMSLHTPH